MELIAAGTPALKALLQRHPGVACSSFQESGSNVIEFEQFGRRRVASVADQRCGENYGLVELMDNNPLVCADAASCPGPAATLALIGLGPLSRAGLLLERASAVFSFEGDYIEVENAGLSCGVTCAGDPTIENDVLMATCLAAIRCDTLGQLTELYDECFARSFFVHQVDDVEFNPETVRGTANAIYAVSFSGEGEGIAKIRIAADKNGKCGASQLVHLFNIMAGFEENLGTA